MELEPFICSGSINRPKIIAFCEIILKNNRYPLSQSELNVNGFTCYNNLMEERKRRICVYIDDILLHKSIEIENSEFKEYVCCNIKYKKEYLTIVCIYIEAQIALKKII